MLRFNKILEMLTYLMEISLGVTVGTLKLDLSQKMAAWARAAAAVC